MAPDVNARSSAFARPPRAASAVRDVGAHGDVHPDIPGHARKHGADHEPEPDLPPEDEREQNDDHDADDGDRPVLPGLRVGRGADLDRARDLLHPVGAGGRREHAAAGDDAVENGEDAADENETVDHRVGSA